MNNNNLKPVSQVIAEKKIMESIRKEFKSEVLGDHTIELLNLTKKSFYGDIIVTDPCNFVGREIWHNLCTLLIDKNKPVELYKSGLAKITLKGKVCEFLYTLTAYGDGDYGLLHNSGTLVGRSSVGVDAGMISVALLEDAKHLSDDASLLDQDYFPKVLNFKGDVFVQNFNFLGDIYVRTDHNFEV